MATVNAGLNACTEEMKALLKDAFAWIHVFRTLTRVTK